MFAFESYKYDTDLLSNILCYTFDYTTKNHCERLNLNFKWTSKACVNCNNDVG